LTQERKLVRDVKKGRTGGSGEGGPGRVVALDPNMKKRAHLPKESKITKLWEKSCVNKADGGRTNGGKSAEGTHLMDGSQRDDREDSKN